MYRAKITAIALCTVATGCVLPPQNRATADETPRLAVVIIVDQMRADYLTRYNNEFAGGFRRLLDDGMVFENAWVDHAFTNSLPGHTSVITGSYPRRHGIVDNIWRERTDNGYALRSGFSVVDRRDGRAYTLGAKTLPEWVIASDRRSKFAAIGSNNATRVYPGELKGTVVWFSSSDNAYITDPVFADALPAWAEQFNESRLPEFAKMEWQSTIPASLASRLRPDDSSFENRGVNTAFPHLPSQLDEDDSWIGATPYSDQATLELAAHAINELALGQDRVPDILAISLTSLDEIGHAYGPFSHEQTDAVLRLDREIGEFMTQLDKKVGKDKWVLALTADHGVAITPEQRRLDGSIEGRRVSREEARAMAEAAYAAVENIDDAAARTEAAKKVVEGFDFVERVYTEGELSRTTSSTETVEGLFANSYWPGRIPEHPFYIRELPVAEFGLVVQLKEDIMMDWGTAIHGSPYDYDRRVPFVMMGAGVGAGTRYDRVSSADVAPSIAKLIGVAPPGEIDGKARIDP